MATRERPLGLFYDPEELTPGARRLHISRNGKGWELREGDGVLLGTHASQAHAIEAARHLSKQQFSEILVRGSTGHVEWKLDQDSEISEITDRLRERHLTDWQAAD